MTLSLEGQPRTSAVGKFQVVLQLGQGGTADVHLALTHGPAGFHKLVVLKVLKKHLAADPEFRAMFLNEAQLAARLQHPNIVQTNEVFEADQVPIMVMEYLDGQPLSQLIVRGKNAGFTRAMQLRALIEALRGLHAAHELADFDGAPLNVVHRDVSPHNLFVTVEGQTKVLDFGIAKLERSLVETEIGTVKGKLRYMAPEQIACGKLDRRADVYAAGVILWEALVGERMWKGASEAEIRGRVLRGELTMPAALCPDVPAELDRICRRALARSPEERYASARELGEELEAAQAGLGDTPSSGAIGAVVSRLFEPERAEAREAVARALDRASLPSPTPGEWAHAASTAGTDPGGIRRRATRDARHRSLRVAGTLAALGLIAAIAALDAPARQHVSSPSANTATAALIAPEPAGDTALPPSNLAASPAAEAPEASEPGPAPLTTAVQMARPAATPARATLDAPPDCDHPFFVDAEGIKRFRPECL